MKAGVIAEVKGQTVVFKKVGDAEQEKVDVGPDVFVKLDGQASSLAALQAGDRCECHEHPDGTLSVLKVRRNVPDGSEASTAAGSTDGTDSFKREPATTEATEQEGDDPVADLTAEEAKDKISRMTSTDKLEAIVVNDKRVTVQKAAQERLEALSVKE